MFGRHSIKTKLFLALIVVMGITASLQLIFISPRLERQKIDEAVKAQEALARQVARKLADELSTAVSELKAIAALPDLRTLERESMDRVIRTANSANHFFNYYFVMDINGRWLSYPTQPHLVGETIPADNLDWVKETFDNGDVVFLDVVKSRIGTLVSGFSTPIRGDDGQAVALLRGVCVISEKNALISTLINIGIGKSGSGYLVASNGWLIANPRLDINYSDFKTYDMKDVAPVKRALAGKNGVMRYTAGATEWIAAYQPIEMTHWALVIQQPYAAVVAGASSEVKMTTASILVAVTFGLLTVGGVMVLALRPLNRLIAQIESGTVPDIMKTSGDEIGRLAAQFKNLYGDLYRTHQSFLTVLDSIDATIYVADMTTHEILFMNRYMIDSFGRDMTGERCFKAFRGMETPCGRCTNSQLLDESGQPKGMVTWQGKNPVTGKHYINYDRAIEWIDGRIVRLQIATDITDLVRLEAERKQYDEKLQQAQKMEALGTLAGGIAHDFNNLLMGIQGRTSLMLLDLDPAQQHHEHLRGIEEYVRSASGLTKQLLGFARGGKYEVKPIDLNAVAAESAAMFGRTRKEIRMHAKMGTPPPTVEADRRQIEQVLLNIYVNAWQAMPEGGDLYLETRSVALDDDYCRPYQVPAGDYAKISITDTGIGINGNILPRIFDPFFTTKEKGRGTGLGLASAYGIIKNHGGMITVYSEKDHGTTFNIYLPVTGKIATAEVQPAGQLMTGKETILLVDDEALILEVGGAMLEKLGYTVITAGGGEKAVSEIAGRDSDIGLVILDMIMPGMDGGKTYDRIREIAPKMRVLLSSGYAINGQAEAIIRRGCDGFIQKPFSIQDLSEKVRQILSRNP